MQNHTKPNCINQNVEQTCTGTETHFLKCLSTKHQKILSVEMTDTILRVTVHVWGILGVHKCTTKSDTLELHQTLQNLKYLLHQTSSYCLDNADTCTM